MYMYIFWTLGTCICTCQSSLIPRPLPKSGERAWYTLFAHAPDISFSLRKKRRALTESSQEVYGRLYTGRIRTNLAMATCRICLSSVETKHCTALFTETGLSQGWPSRVRDLLRVKVAKDDGLPSHICKSCRNNLVTRLPRRGFSTRSESFVWRWPADIRGTWWMEILRRIVWTSLRSKLRTGTLWWLFLL